MARQTITTDVVADDAMSDQPSGGNLIAQATQHAITASLEHAEPSSPDGPRADVGSAVAIASQPTEVLKIAAPATASEPQPPSASTDLTLASTEPTEPRQPPSGRMAKTQTLTTQETIMTTAEDFMAFGQGNIEAVMKSGQIWAAGVQDLGKHLAASAQAQIDQTLSTWKAMAGIKSVREAFDMQTGLARSAVETAVAETGKLTGASFKLSEQALQPIAARVSLAVEKFGRTHA